MSRLRSSALALARMGRAPSWRRSILFGALALVGSGTGCQSPRSIVRDAREEGTVRIFGGVAVSGSYVSPVAYGHYLEAQLASLDGAHEEAVTALMRAIASDGASAYLRTRFGEELAALGRVDEARDAFEAALRFDPGFAEAHVGLGRLALRLGDKPQAETDWKRAIELDRGCEDAWLQLGALYRDRGENARADELYRTMALRVPESPAAHRELARAAMMRGDLHGAVDSLRKALAISPSHIEARIDLGRALHAMHHDSEAERELRLAWERSHHDPRVAELLIGLALAAGHHDEADLLLEQLDAGVGPVDRRLQVGWLLLARQRADRALGITVDVMRSGERPSARLLQGAALAELGRLDEAAEVLRKIPTDAPEYARAQLHVARARLAAGRSQEATQQLARAISALEASAAPGGQGPGPGRDLLVSLLAEVRERAGEGPEARQLLEGALKLRPDSDALLYALGGLLERAGDPDRACETVQRILDHAPDHVEALNFIGWSYTERGIRLRDAERLLERALALRPTSGEIADSLGWLYLKLGRVDESVRSLESAARLLPGAAEVARHLGEAYAEHKDRGKAVASFRRALAADPDARTRKAVEERLIHLEEGRVGTR